MRFTKYSKWTGQSWDDISLEELMEALTDHLLRSGFEDQFRFELGEFPVVGRRLPERKKPMQKGHGGTRV